MKKLIIDMDDVITSIDYFVEFEKFAGKKLDHSYNGYHLEDVLGDQKEAFFANFDQINFYDYAVILDDAASVLKELNKHYDLYICSSFVWSCAFEKASTHLKNKYDYLYKNLGFISPDKYIFTSNKGIIKADIRIDDKLENLKNGKIKLLYTAWHNKDYTDEYLKSKNVIRVNNWKEIRKILLNEE